MHDLFMLWWCWKVTTGSLSTWVTSVFLCSSYVLVLAGRFCVLVLVYPGCLRYSHQSYLMVTPRLDLTLVSNLRLYYILVSGSDISPYFSSCSDTR